MAQPDNATALLPLSINSTFQPGFHPGLSDFTLSTDCLNSITKYTHLMWSQVDAENSNSLRRKRLFSELCGKTQLLGNILANPAYLQLSMPCSLPLSPEAHTPTIYYITKHGSVDITQPSSLHYTTWFCTLHNMVEGPLCCIQNKTKKKSLLFLIDEFWGYILLLLVLFYRKNKTPSGYKETLAMSYGTL